MTILFPIIVVGSVGLFFGIVLGFASNKFAVPTDERIEKVAEVLPNVNCGACGYAGCSAFAKAIVEGKAPVNGCIPGGIKTAEAISKIMGITAESTEPMMAVVHCKGGDKEAKKRAKYNGIKDCNAAILTSNGEKECLYGCLGLGTCVEVCPFDAIFINDNGTAQVIPDKCTGCGKCVEACPQNIIELIPKMHKIYLACSNHEKGAKVKKECSVGCTACTLCVKATPSGAITMVNDLPKLDYTMNENFIVAAYKCPSKCFVDLAVARPKANIDTKCTGCNKCVEICPVKGAITGTPGQRYTVDKTKCIGCGLCLDICPEHAITLWGGLGYQQK